MIIIKKLNAPLFTFDDLPIDSFFVNGNNELCYKTDDKNSLWFGDDIIEFDYSEEYDVRDVVAKVEVEIRVLPINDSKQDENNRQILIDLLKTKKLTKQQKAAITELLNR